MPTRAAGEVELTTTIVSAPAATWRQSQEEYSDHCTQEGFEIVPHRKRPLALQGRHHSCIQHRLKTSCSQRLPLWYVRCLAGH